MRLSEIQAEFMMDVAKLIVFAHHQGIAVTGGELYRTQDQQELYYYGKTVRPEEGQLEMISGKVRSKTMNSKHLKRLAIDLNFFIDGRLTYELKDIEVLGEYWELLNPKNKAGMFFKSFYDAPHFQRSV